MICTFGRKQLSPGDSSAYMSVFLFSLTLFVRSIILGIIIVMFFHSITALFNPTNRRSEGTKWGFVIYNFLMF